MAKNHKLLNFRVTPDIFEMMERRYEQAGYHNMSAYVRHLIYEDLKKWSKPTFDRARKTRFKTPSEWLEE